MCAWEPSRPEVTSGLTGGEPSASQELEGVRLSPDTATQGSRKTCVLEGLHDDEVARRAGTEFRFSFNFAAPSKSLQATTMCPDGVVLDWA